MCVCVCARAQSLSCILFAGPIDCSLPGSPVHGIFQARILGVLPFSSSGNLPDPGIEPASLVSPALASGFFTARSTGEKQCYKNNEWQDNFRAFSQVVLAIMFDMNVKKLT